LRGAFVAVEPGRWQMKVHAGIRSWSTAVEKISSPALQDQW
jgi:hypothetical protein